MFTACLLQIAAITTTKSILKQHLSSCYLYLVDVGIKEDVTNGKDVGMAKQGKDNTKVRRWIVKLDVICSIAFNGTYDVELLLEGYENLCLMTHYHTCSITVS